MRVEMLAVATVRRGTAQIGRCGLPYLSGPRTDFGDSMLDGLSDAEWRELTELVHTCSDDRLASVVHDIARIPGRTLRSLDSSAATPAGAPRGVTRRILAGGWFYRALLDELRRRRNERLFNAQPRNGL